MRRRYLALVEGRVADDRGEIDAPIGRSTRAPTKMAVSSSGRPARTGYTVLERRSEPRELTLLELSLESGRTHQIRVHMAAIGHPVVGDARYGAPDRRLGSGRFFLHAGRLAFTHPKSHERVEFSAPLPEDLAGY
jgi:23S rRNA pseudouridine1911/1915/1917 synthase